MPDERAVDFAQLDQDVPYTTAAPILISISMHDRTELRRCGTSDTEFIEDGRTIELISSGWSNGRGNTTQIHEFDPERAGSWVRTMLLPKLPPPSRLATVALRQAIRLDLKFLIDGTDSSSCGLGEGGLRPCSTCVWGPMTLPPHCPVSPGTATVIGDREFLPTDSPPGHATSTTRAGRARIRCAISSSATDDTGRGLPAGQSKIPPARTRANLAWRPQEAPRIRRLTMDQWTVDIPIDRLRRSAAAGSLRYAGRALAKRSGNNLARPTRRWRYARWRATTRDGTVHIRLQSSWPGTG